MENTRYNKLAMRTLSVVILMLASILAFTLYHLIANPKTNIHGASGSTNVSIQVGPAPCSPPSISDIIPLTGPESGGTEATIMGDNLNCVDEVIVDSSLRCAPIVHISNNELRCIMPSHMKGYVDVTVVAPGYGVYTKDNGFRYLSSGNLPLPPNTGLFRLGKQIVTLYDVLILTAITVLCIVIAWLILWKRPNRRKADKRV